MAPKRTSKKIAHTVEQAAEGAEHALAGTAEKVVKVVKDVAGAAADMAEQMAGVEEAAVDGPESTPETDGKELADKNSDEGKKLTMEEREAKLVQIRKKFVCFTFFFSLPFCEVANQTNPAHQSVPFI